MGIVDPGVPDGNPGPAARPRHRPDYLARIANKHVVTMVKPIQSAADASTHTTSAQKPHEQYPEDPSQRGRLSARRARAGSAIRHNLQPSKENQDNDDNNETQEEKSECIPPRIYNDIAHRSSLPQSEHAARDCRLPHEARRSRLLTLYIYWKSLTFDPSFRIIFLCSLRAVKEPLATHQLLACPPHAAGGSVPTLSRWGTRTR